MTKILFLDIDGVLISTRAAYLPNQTSIWSIFDPVAVALLNHVSEKISDLEIVVHSSWSKTEFWRRISKRREEEYTLEQNLTDYIRNQGVTCKFHTDWTTPKKFSSNRWAEINWWMEDHPEINTKDVLILDDESAPNEYPYTLIQTDYYDGLLFRDFIKILEHFGAKK